MKRPVITLLTDFGTSDYYVGAMKGVILSICPDAQIVDITHEIAPWQVGHGAWMLAQAWGCFPPGTVHIAVVDPGVGSNRRPLLAAAGGHLFVAPDNGVLTRVLAQTPPDAVREITESRYFRLPLSQTFHGRDLFAPVAAHLACSVPPENFGPELKTFTHLPSVAPRQTGEGEWQGEVLWVDRFGNVVTCFDMDSFGWVSGEPFMLELNGITVQKYQQYYGAMPANVLHLTGGSAGYLEVSVNQQDAACFLAVGAGSPVILRRV
jgi:S-adenosylmethionine hydrolase